MRFINPNVTDNPHAMTNNNLLSPALKKGVFSIDWTDEVFAGTVLTHGGQVKHEPTAKLLANG